MGFRVPVSQPKESHCDKQSAPPTFVGFPTSSEENWDAKTNLFTELAFVCGTFRWDFCKAEAEARCRCYQHIRLRNLALRQ